MAREPTDKNASEQLTKRDLLRAGGAGLAGLALGRGAARPARAATGPAHLVLVHGHAMQIEYPERLESFVRKGYHTRVYGKPGTDNWFHFAVPTLSILEGEAQRVHLERHRLSAAQLECENLVRLDAFEEGNGTVVDALHGLPRLGHFLG